MRHNLTDIPDEIPPSPDATPWMPPNAWEPKAGDRVAIQLSGECDFRCPNGCDWHKKFQSAREGSVFPTFWDKTLGVKCTQCNLITDITLVQSAHTYAVRVGDEGGWFALSELAPIDEDADTNKPEGDTK